MISVILILWRVSLRKPTSFKDLENPYYIDLMFTNSPNSFQNSRSIETGLFDFHNCNYFENKI